jgi:N-glycosylase/DNA lyase
VRITSLLHKLCERFSAPLLADDENDTVYRLFPSSTQIPTDGLEAVLRELGFGYRAGYLSCTLSALKERGSGSVEDELARWRSLPLDQVRDELLALKGVGRKVADCVMLMCMDQVCAMYRTHAHSSPH